MPFFRIAVFLVVVNAISISLHAYVGSRLVSLLPAGSSTAKAVWVALAALYAIMFATMFLSRWAHPALWVRATVMTGYVWMGVVFLLLVAGLVGDSIGLVLRAAGGLSGMDFAMAARWAKIGLFATVPLLASYGIWQALRPPEIHEVEIRVPGLAKEWDGVRIAHVTDTHVGLILRKSWVEDLVRRVDSAKPDIVVHTGDLVDGSLEGLKDDLAPISRLKGREGTFFVTGNHEGYSGIRPWCGQMRAWGWDVLANESRILTRGGAKLAVAGVTDAHEGGIRSGTAPDVAQALSRVPTGIPVVLLAHQPRQALQAQQRGVSLQLSGHTHGGQIWPFHYLVRLQQPMNAGYAKVGEVPVFTSRGAGFWGPPLRIGAPAEVPIVVLRGV